MKELVIGVLGGMGTYATIHLFEQYAELFSAKKEWDRPRIVIDNRCTMPSRVRAFLYNENTNLLVDEMADSMQHLCDAGCNKIILACNTSHLFLPSIYKKVPQLQERVVSIIDKCVEQIERDSIKSIFILGSEGTIESKIYQNALETRGINCIVPSKDEYNLLRQCIEAVKQKKYSDEVKDIFLNLICAHETCLLGCTELPILFDKYADGTSGTKIYDPVYLALKELKREYDNDKNINIWSI